MSANQLLLIVSILLRLASAFYAVRLIRVAHDRKSWILISIAFVLLGLSSFFEIMDIENQDMSASSCFRYCLSLFISLLLLTGVVSIGRVLRNLKRAEKSRYISEQRFKTLFNNSGDEMFVTDFEGNIIEVNKAACTILDYVKTELLTMNMSDICSSAYLMELPKKIEATQKGGKYRFESEHVTREGKIIPVETRNRVVYFEDHQFILWIARDISERKEIEKRILSVVIDTEEQERERFAKDLHDGLGPLLSTIKLYVNELDGDITEKEKKEYISQLNDMIDESITSIRSISNNLTPHVISKYGLVKAINSFIKKINTIHKIDIHFKTVNVNRKFNRTIELIFFRVITELINNTVKHAKADNIHIILEVINDKLILSYRDDGTGFDVDEAMKRGPEGIGIKNIKSRIESLNGSVSFYNHEAKGTNIKIKVNLEPEI